MIFLQEETINEEKLIDFLFKIINYKEIFLHPNFKDIKRIFVDKMSFDFFINLNDLFKEYDKNKSVNLRKEIKNSLSENIKTIEEELIKNFGENDEIINKLIDKIKYIAESFNILICLTDEIPLYEEKYEYITKVSEEIYSKIIEELKKRDIEYKILKNNEILIKCKDRNCLYFINNFINKLKKDSNLLLDVKKGIKEMKGKNKIVKTLSDKELLDIQRQGRKAKIIPQGVFKSDIKKSGLRNDPYGRKYLKHKGKLDREELSESILGISSVPIISRIKTLAGINSDSDCECKKEYSENLNRILLLLDEIEDLFVKLNSDEIDVVIERIKKFLDV